jgi:hypothetical protein
MLLFNTRYHLLLSGVQEYLKFFFLHLSSFRHQHNFQKGGSILTLTTFSLRSLGQHRENHHYFLISLTPITFDFRKLSCQGGSYYATIAVVSYQSKTSEVDRPLIPMIHRHFLQSSITRFRASSLVKTVIFRYQSPPRVLHLSTIASIISYSLHFGLMT